MKRLVRTTLGTLVLAAIATAVTIACSDGLTDLRTPGQTRVLLTDSPFPFDDVASVNVYVVEIDASTQADTGSNADEQYWTNIVKPEKQFDLLQLQSGSAALVGEGDLPADLYKSVRVVIDGDKSQIAMKDGSRPLVDWQGGLMSLNAFVEDPLDVPEDGASIVIDFDVGRSFSYMAGSDSVPDYFVFFPVLRAVNEAATGTLVGTVTVDPDGDGRYEPVEGSVITVQFGDPTWPSNTWWTAATGRSDASGAYRIAYLSERQFIVTAEPPRAVAAQPVTQVEVGIMRGQETRRDFQLPKTSEASVTIDASETLEVGATVTLRAHVTDALGNPVADPEVGWSTNQWDIVSLVAADSGVGSDSALATGTRAGYATITASSLGIQDSVRIHVVDPNTGPVNSVTLNPAGPLSVSVGDSLSFLAVVKDSAGHELGDRTVDWAISDSTVVSVMGVQSNALYLWAIEAGTVTITATCEGKSASAEVTVG